MVSGQQKSGIAFLQRILATAAALEPLKSMSMCVGFMAFMCRRCHSRPCPAQTLSQHLVSQASSVMLFVHHPAGYHGSRPTARGVGGAELLCPGMPGHQSRSSAKDLVRRGCSLTAAGCCGAAGATCATPSGPLMPAAASAAKADDAASGLLTAVG